MLVLLVADLQSTHWLGPILAIGIAVMLAAAFTLLPALLSLLGERAFWPARRGRAATRVERNRERLDAGRRAGAAALAGRSSSLVFAGLIVLALGNFTHHGTIGFGQGETRPTNSSRGTAVLNEHFPPGIGSPLTAVVNAAKRAAVVGGDEGARHGQAGAAGAADRRHRRDRGRRRPPRQPLLGRSRRRGRGDPRTPARDRSRRPARRHPGRELRHRADQRPRHAG